MKLGLLIWFVATMFMAEVCVLVDSNKTIFIPTIFLIASYLILSFECGKLLSLEEEQ